MRLGRLACFVALVLQVTVASAIAQTFVFGAQGEPVQLDPAVITDGISSRLTRQMFDGLVKYSGATTEVEPALAEKWEVSKDGKVWTFQIRKGVKFHDGNPLDAAAVVWNFERWWKAAHPQHDNQLKAGQTFEYWEGQFGGFDDKSIVSAVEAVGTHTVRITLKEPQAPFLANLAMFVFDIASPKAVESWGTEFGKHPVGTGAYKLVEWKPNQEVVLEANPDYWGQKPKIKRLVVRNIKDNSQRLRRAQGRRDPRHGRAQSRRRQRRQGRRESQAAAAPDQHHGLHRLQLQGEGVPGQAGAPGLRARHQPARHRRRALRGHRPRGQPVPASGAVGLQP